MTDTPGSSQQGPSGPSSEVSGTSGATSGTAMATMFGRIARWYDPLNRLLSMGLDQRWRHCLAEVAIPGPSGRVLDLAAGTLDVSIALHQRYPHLCIPAMDVCLPMLSRGQAKLQSLNEDAAQARQAGFGMQPESKIQPDQNTHSNHKGMPNIWPTVADARALPLPDACVDTITMAFGIRNINPRQQAFTEMYRVLTPGGRACILEFGTGRQKIWGGVYNFYLKSLLPRIGGLCSGDGAYAYLARTIMHFPTADELAEEMRLAGFAQVYHVPLSSGIVRLHVAKK